METAEQEGMKLVRLRDYKFLFLLVDLLRRGEFEKAKMYADRFYDEDRTE